ncbi:hypothetical protein BKA70DRAFT_1240420 [Coprinopsis sp. MPI-PUGE-AT-0042]|nr:hypothetical protein BKA70DRAFT_1240420 [Coprinopsis sp. MPI-PUGE-AT-0042]
MQVRFITSLIAVICASAMTAHALPASLVVADLFREYIPAIERVVVPPRGRDLAKPFGVGTPDKTGRVLELAPAALDTLNESDRWKERMNHVGVFKDMVFLRGVLDEFEDGSDVSALLSTEGRLTRECGERESEEGIHEFIYPSQLRRMGQAGDTVWIQEQGCAPHRDYLLIEHELVACRRQRPAWNLAHSSFLPSFLTVTTVACPHYADLLRLTRHCTTTGATKRLGMMDLDPVPYSLLPARRKSSPPSSHPYCRTQSASPITVNPWLRPAHQTPHLIQRTISHAASLSLRFTNAFLPPDPPFRRLSVLGPLDARYRPYLVSLGVDDVPILLPTKCHHLFVLFT